MRARQGNDRAGLLSSRLQDARFRVSGAHLRGRVLDFGAHHGTLAPRCSPDRYLGVEHDPEFLATARREHPDFTFVTEIPPGQTFDTIAALAVIEHVKDPGSLLGLFAGALAPGGQIVLTTPHPWFEWIHTVGAKVGLFSHHAHDDHEDLINRAQMQRLAAAHGLALVTYKRFMFGANQLFVLRRES